MTSPLPTVVERDEEAEPAIETLGISRVESRAVLDHQIDLLNEIDDRALRTVRTSIVVLALLVSAGQIAGTSRIRSLRWLPVTAAAAAAVLFVVAILVGMAIYSVSHVPYGIGPTHRTEARDGGYSERKWLTLLMDEYDDWSLELLELTENNARWLAYAQGSFVLGTVVIAVAIAIPLSTIGRATVVLSTVLGAGLIVQGRIPTGDDR